MAPSPYVRARSATAPTLLTALCALTVAGCGSGVGDNLFLYALPADSCGGVLGRVRPATDVVLLDWSGGRSDLFDDLQLDPLDLSAFATLDGSTLADDGEAFKDAVIAETATILCDIPGAAVHVTGSKVSLPSDFTTVHIAQVFSPTGGGQIGEGSFDPCNVGHNDAAVIFGEELRRLGGPFTFDEWVLMFANVTAHEIGHTLGLGHVARRPHDASARPLYVELMLATHTVSEMIREQRYLASESNCPSDGDVLRRRVDLDGPCVVTSD